MLVTVQKLTMIKLLQGSPSMHYIQKSLLFIILCLCSYGAYSTTDENSFALKALQIEKDINSVDYLSGQYYPQIPSLSINAAPRLSFHTMQSFNSKITAKLAASSPDTGISSYKAWFSLTYGGITSESFTCEEVCDTGTQTGSALFGRMVHERTKAERSFVYTQGGTGLKIRYSDLSSFFEYSNPYAKIAAQGTWYATSVTYPDGEILSIVYTKVLDPLINPYLTFHRPHTVKSSIGYQLNFTYQSDDLSTGTFGWSKIASASISKSSSPELALVKYTYGDGTVTDDLGRIWSYTGFSSAIGERDTAKEFTLKQPGNSHTQIQIKSDSKDYAGTVHNDFVTQVTNNNLTYNYKYTPATKNGTSSKNYFSKLSIQAQMLTAVKLCLMCQNMNRSLPQYNQ